MKKIRKCVLQKGKKVTSIFGKKIFNTPKYLFYKKFKFLHQFSFEHEREKIRQMQSQTKKVEYFMQIRNFAPRVCAEGGPLPLLCQQLGVDHHQARIGNASGIPPVNGSFWFLFF